MTFWFILFSILPAQAQIGGSSSPVLMEATANGRYEIKPIKSVKKRSPASETTASPETPVAAPAKAMTPAVAPPVTPEVVQYQEPEKDDPIDIFSRDQFDEDDIRKNKMEITVAPTFVYNGSTSNYSYRNYSSFFSALDLSSNVWMTPTLGLHGRILFSFGAGVAGDSTTGSKIPVKYEDIDLALKFRRFFNSAKDSASVEMDLLYSEDKFSPPSDNNFRPKLTSTGLGARVTSKFPSGNNFSWVFGGLFYPRIQHQEDKVGLTIRSGTPSENARLGVNLGAELRFNRGSQVVYDLAVTSERDSFDGAANPVDPETSKSPSNVSVTNTMLMFSFGYRWGR